MNIEYNAAIYCRLSREDENIAQSESIKNQIEYLNKYVLEQGWNVAGIYTDDGYTGSNFDRPAFKNMLLDIQNKQINIVVTKDLSRLGRDYIETGHYIERFFPENNIRFIAVNDGIDTFTDNIANEMSPFKSVINDLYAKDISKKVKSIFKSKVESGKFIGAFAPYGYKKHPMDKNKLVIDEIAASIVKKIFQCYLSGQGPSCIANMLNNEAVPAPSVYKSSLYKSYANGRTKNNLWGHCSVKNILINPTYTGNITQHKYKKINYKSKKLIALGKNNWIMIKNTHEPIISTEDFETVQSMMKRKSTHKSHSKTSSRLFSGLVFCGECGEYMTLIKTPKGIEYLICSRYKKFSSKYCSRHSIQIKILEHAVLQDIASLIKLAANDKYLLTDFTLTRNTLEKFIEKIDILKSNHICITYKFKPLDN